MEIVNLVIQLAKLAVLKILNCVFHVIQIQLTIHISKGPHAQNSAFMEPLLTTIFKNAKAVHLPV